MVTLELKINLKKYQNISNFNRSTRKNYMTKKKKDIFKPTFYDPFRLFRNIFNDSLISHHLYQMHWYLIQVINLVALTIILGR